MDASDRTESAGRPAGRLERPAGGRVPIWANLKWALVVLTATVGVWWIAGPIVRLLGLDELAP